MEVVARREAGALILVVRNSGSGLPENIREGVGLRTCRERLQVIYGDAAVLSLKQSAGVVDASICLPWREQAA